MAPVQARAAAAAAAVLRQPVSPSAILTSVVMAAQACSQALPEPRRGMQKAAAAARSTARPLAQAVRRVVLVVLDPATPVGLQMTTLDLVAAEAVIQALREAQAAPAGQASSY
jgi:hypothetical protein